MVEWSTTPPANQGSAHESHAGHAHAGHPHHTGGSYGLTGVYSCDDCGRISCSCRSGWYGGIYGVMMTRDDENNRWLSFDSDFVTQHLLDSRDADMPWSYGGEVRLGRLFNCDRNAIEAVYWGIFPDQQEANVLGAGLTGQLNTTLSFNALEYDNMAGGVPNPLPVTNYYDGVERHRLRRNYELYNIEVNLLQLPCIATPCGPCGPVGPRYRGTWFAGLRYLRFGENFNFASDHTTNVFGDDVDEEMFYFIDVQNHLIGGQIGGRGEWFFCNGRLSLFAGAKAGIFGNHMTHQHFIGGAAGAATVDLPGTPNDGVAIDIESNRDDLSFIGELDLGMGYAINHCWTFRAGYRVVGVSGIALSTNQIPNSFSDIEGVRNINSNGSLLLHGGYAGLELNY